MRRRLLYAWLLALATLAGSAAAQDVTPPDATPPDATPPDAANRDVSTREVNAPGVLRVALEPREVTVGGRVEATLTLVWMGERPEAPPRFPSFGDGWGEAEVLESSGVELHEDGAGRMIYRQTLELASFRVGPVELPPPSVAVPLVERTVEVTASPASSDGWDDALTFEVVSVLPDTSTTDDSESATDPASAADPSSSSQGSAEAAVEPKPPAPPLPLETPRRYPWTALALLALIALGLHRLAARLRALPDEATADGPAVDSLSHLPPLEELRRRLAAVDSTQPHRAHVAISRALRVFVGRRLGMLAVEATTTEIQRALQRRAGRRRVRLPHDLARRLVELLRACDQVKFAGRAVDEDRARRRLEEAASVATAVDEAARAAEVQLATTSVAGRPEHEVAA